MKRARTLWWLAPLLALAAGAYWFVGPVERDALELVEPPRPTGPGDVGARSTAARPLPSRSTQRKAVLHNAEGPRLAGSLAGTDVDGELRVGPDGHLRVGPEVAAFFEYFLAGLGELPEEELLARVRAEIDARLASPAREQAKQLLARYVDYRRDAAALPPPGDEGVESRIETLYALRREAFGSAQALQLFAAEEAHRTAALERMQLLKDETLSPEQRQQALAALRADMAPELREAWDRAQAPLQGERTVDRLRAEGADEAEVFQARRERHGQAAAERLADLDRRRAAFRARVAEHHRAVDALYEDPELNDAERASAAEALLESAFMPRVRARVRAQLRR